MNYKVLTIKERIEVGADPIESSTDALKPYLEDGYKLINASSSHAFKQDMVFGDLKEKPTLIFMFTTYFLSKEG